VTVNPSDPAGFGQRRRSWASTGGVAGVALTGSGGPVAQDGMPPGTVYLAAAGEPGGAEVLRLDLVGEPGEVCADAAAEALRTVAARLEC
jgi:nicotinamide-nucleotide amidase